MPSGSSPCCIAHAWSERSGWRTCTWSHTSRVERSKCTYQIEKNNNRMTRPSAPIDTTALRSHSYFSFSIFSCILFPSEPQRMPLSLFIVWVPSPVPSLVPLFCIPFGRCASGSSDCCNWSRRHFTLLLPSLLDTMKQKHTSTVPFQH